MTTPIDIVRWAESFVILPTTKRRIKFQPHQKSILSHVFTPGADGRFPYQTIVYSCPKKSGKTCLNAIIQGWFLFEIEAPNEVICCANKKDQAVARGFRELKGFIERNRDLASEAKLLGRDQIVLKNGSICTAIPNDFSGEAGSNHGLVTFDELWAYTSERDRRLWEELTQVPTRLNSVKVVTTYSGSEGESALLEELYQTVLATDGKPKEGVTMPLPGLPCYVKGGLFCYWDTVGRMPWQTPRYYEEQRRSLRTNTYLRLHENRWVSSESGLFDMEKWDACTDAGYSPPLPDKSIGLYVGVDASTKRDRAAVVSVYRDQGKIKLGPKRFWQPSKEDPLDLEDTMESYLLELHRGYRLIRVNFDPYQFHRSAVTLLKKGVPMAEYLQTIPGLTEMGQNLYDLVNTGQLVLYPDKDLRHEANSCIAKETSRGLRIAKEVGTAKIDQVVALAMAAVAAVLRGEAAFQNLERCLRGGEDEYPVSDYEV